MKIISKVIYTIGTILIILLFHRAIDNFLNIMTAIWLKLFTDTNIDPNIVSDYNIKFVSSILLSILVWILMLDCVIVKFYRGNVKLTNKRK
jgi:hypothetical protein